MSARRNFSLSFVGATLQSVASRWIFSAFGAWTLLAIAAIALVWTRAGALNVNGYQPFATDSRKVIATLVVALVWLFGLLFTRWRTGTVKPKVEAPPPRPKDPVEDEIEAMRVAFRNAMKTIRSKWIGSGGGGRSLYALPWYLVVGPQDSGKTSLLADSDMKFPISHLLGLDSYKTVRATATPQYWVTNEAVIFDLPGSWLTFDDKPFEPGDGGEAKPTREQRLWSAFSELLVEHRPRRPLNGVILTFDGVELVRATNETRGNLSAAVHGRLVDLVEKLGTRFGVYVLINKLDRFAGFREYFQLLSKPERLAPFGFVFKVNDEAHADAWVEEFSSAHANFMAKVNDDLVDRLYAQRDGATRKAIYAFTREMSSFGATLREFLAACCHSDRFSTPPMIRGVFYTSTRQEGVPFNALLTRISGEYQLPAPILPAYSGLSGPYFVGRLFPQTIFREAGLAGDNKVVERRKVVAVNATGLAAALALVTMGFYLHDARLDNARRSHAVVEKTKAFVSMPLGADPTSEITSLRPAMDAIRAATEEFPGWRDRSEASHVFALYQGRRVGPEVERVYSALLQDRFLPALASQLRMRIAEMGASPETRDEDERLNLLRVYLLLADKARRDELDARPGENGDPSFVGTRTIKAYFADAWQQSYVGSRDVQTSLNAHLAHALDIAQLAAPLDEASVESARADFRKVDRTQRILRRLERLAELQNPTPISFRKEIGPAFDLIFDQTKDAPLLGRDVAIPFFYTKKGFLEFFVPQNEKIAAIVVEDAWVIGERQTVAYSSEDLNAFKDSVLKRYVSTYIGVWDQAINALEITPFKDIDHAVSVVENITGPSNGLGRLLSLIRANTVIYEPKTQAVSKDEPVKALDAQQPAMDVVRAEGLRIARRFDPLARLIVANEKERPYFEELLGSIGALESYLREIQAGRASSKQMALERARERAQLKAPRDPISDLQKIGVGQPAPLNKMIGKIAYESWKVVLDAAKLDLQHVWQNDVHREYEVRLAGKFPFRRSAQEEVTLDEFQAFFGPEGGFERFFKTYLSTFFDEATRQPKIIDRQSMSVRQEFLTELDKLRQIRTIFFDSRGAPSLRYQIEPVSLSGRAGAATLNLEGQLVPYRHGPPQTFTILWPNASTNQNAGSSLTISGEATGAVSFKGVWSSFRLLESGRVVSARKEGDSIDLMISLNGASVLYRIRALAPVNPFRAHPLLNLRLPQTL